MKLINRHIARSVLVSSLLMTITLVGILNLLEFMDELRSTGRGRYDALTAFHYVLLITPRAFY